MKVISVKKQTPAKQQILYLLKKNKSLTMDEMMCHFSISEVAVRKHIHGLEQQKLVKKTSHKQKIGRPFYTYELTKIGHGTFPNQYESLPVELLQDLEEMQGTESVHALLLKRMEREKDQYERKLSSDNFDDKVMEVARLQNEKGYMVEIHETEEGQIELRNYHCPIANLASSYRQVCTNEKKIFETLFQESEVSAASNIAAGEHVCKWVITRPEGKI